MIKLVQTKIRGYKTPKKDIVIIGDFMIKLVNGPEFHYPDQLKLEAIWVQ